LPAFYNYDILYVEVIKNDKKERENVELGMPLAVNGEKTIRSVYQVLPYKGTPRIQLVNNLYALCLRRGYDFGLCIFWMKEE